MKHIAYCIKLNLVLSYTYIYWQYYYKENNIYGFLLFPFIGHVGIYEWLYHNNIDNIVVSQTINQVDCHCDCKDWLLLIKHGYKNVCIYQKV